MGADTDGTVKKIEVKGSSRQISHSYETDLITWFAAFVHAGFSHAIVDAFVLLAWTVLGQTLKEQFLNQVDKWHLLLQKQKPVIFSVER